jgi:phosphatidylethanolamine/phosphatidyl-N-methylethanolamine N-methyltransferase
MAHALQTAQVANAYGRWAPVYDLVFGPVFRRGRASAIVAAEQIGGHILEIGVGTGISLPDYARSSRLTGVDISEPMLAKARARVDRLGLDNVQAIEVMDAERLRYADGSFDVVVAQYVVTACPNPERALDEAMRVLRPGGELIITTRIGAEGGLRGVIEKALMPVTGRLGWRTEFPFGRYARWAERAAGVRLIERRALPPLGHFSLLRFQKVPAAAAAAEARPQPQAHEVG